jgi:succinoglycan biosynthesis protein ExoA
VTVVIPARNEERFIGRCLESVLAQDEPRLQVIVVDGDSQDGTVDVVTEIARRDPRVELLHNPQRIIPKSLNLALRAARGRFLVRVDAHATVPSGYVRTAVEHLRTQRWGGVGGRKQAVGVTPAGDAIAAAMASPFGVGNSTYHYGARVETVEHIPFGAYPTELASRMGGWDERLAVNQDFEFDYRLRKAGYDLLFDPRLEIAWHCRQSIPDFFSQYRRYGRGKAVVARLHPRSLRARHLAAPALIGSWVLGVALLPLVPWLALPILAPYPLALAAATLATARKVRGSARWWIAPAFFAMHVGWGLGFWEGVLRPPVKGLKREARGAPERSSEVSV